MIDEERKEQLKKEWSSENEYEFEHYSRGSGFRAKWVCSEGHKWESPVRVRYKGHGCPYCSGLLIIKGVNDFESMYPEIAAQWHPNKNGSLKPSDFNSMNHKRVWWMCDKGHEWESSIANRVRSLRIRKNYNNNLNGCPACSHKVNVKKHSLAEMFPELCKEWDYSKNELGPECYAPHSGRRVYWICEKGHSWSATIDVRTGKNHPSGCPYCAGRYAIPGETDLETKRPDLTMEWDYERNVLKPSEVLPFSRKKVFWHCTNGHVYKATIEDRALGTGCPECHGFINKLRKQTEKNRRK